jgi:hypothetical protein
MAAERERMQSAFARHGLKFARQQVPTGWLAAVILLAVMKKEFGS